MKKTNRYIMMAAAFTAVAYGLTACAERDEMEDQASGRITFTLSVQDATAMTRAAQTQESIPLTGEDCQLWLLPSVAPTTSSPFWGNQRGTTRGTQITTASSMTSFGVSAFCHPQSDAGLGDATPSFLYNVQATPSGNNYTVNGNYFWPSGTDILDFQAYYPYNSENVSLSAIDVKGPQKITFTVNEDVKKQCDLMTAHAQSESFKNHLSPSVPLKFYHRLAAVKFVVGTKFVAGCVKKITLKNVHKSGVYTLGSEVGEGWATELENNTGDFTLEHATSVTVAGTEGEAITASDETFLVIPQDFTDNDSAAIEVVFTNGTANGDKTVTAPLKGQKWAEGTTITYALSSQNLTTLHVSTIGFASTVSGAPKTGWENEDEVGLYIVDGTVVENDEQHDGKQLVGNNIKLTYSSTTGEWSFPANTQINDRPGYKFYFYYPYKDDMNITESPKVDATADEFFAGLISDWNISTETNAVNSHADQHTLEKFTKADLQVAKGVYDDPVSTVKASMSRKVGLARFKLAASKTIPQTITYTNNGSKQTTGSVEIVPSANFLNYIPYRNTVNSTYYFWTPADVAVTFNCLPTEMHQWKETVIANLAAGAYTATVPTVVEYRDAWTCTESTTWLYTYNTNKVYRTFTSTDAGTYKMECWGASGGQSTENACWGKGGYTKGEMTLNTPTTFYIYIGGEGVNINSTTGNRAEDSYNGGASVGSSPESYDCSGGGATDIRLTSGAWNNFASLCSRIMVAAGAGGHDDNVLTSAHAGGLVGYYGDQGQNVIDYPNQFHGGKIGSGYASQYGYFGYALQGTANKSVNSSGGGGGYYGGGCSDRGTQGGSSFISGHAGCSAIKALVDSEADITHKATEGDPTTLTVANATHYSGKAFTNTVMIDGAGYEWTTEKGNYRQMPKPGEGNYGQGVGHNGNGYCRITLTK